MRQATTRNAPRFGATSQVFTFPAPIGGLNTRDPISALPLTDSPYMAYCYPSATGIQAVPWEYSFATTTAEAETLMVYTTAAGADTLFAAIGTKFYDYTAGGSGTQVVTGLTNAKWQWINFANSGGTIYLCCFNGVDSPQYWNGTSWITITGISTPSITGLTTSTIANVFIHQRRMWLIQVNSLKAWYLPIDSVGGAAQALDLGGIAYKGGYIMAGGTWTIDAGDGVNDYWAIITSEGQVVIYQGYDPSSASSWELVGVWNISPPLDRTSVYKYQNDLLFIVKEGIVSIRKLINGDKPITITDKISGTYKNFILYPGASDARWHLVEDPARDLLILCPQDNAGWMPMNRLTGAWGGQSRITKYMVYFNGEIYGSTNLNKIYRFDNTSGTQLSAADYALATAFSNMEVPGKLKNIRQMRVLMSDTSVSVIGSNLQYKTGILTNYADPTIYINGTSSPTDTVPFAVGWQPWRQIGASGDSIAAWLDIRPDPTFVCGGFQVLFEYGGLS